MTEVIGHATVTTAQHTFFGTKCEKCNRIHDLHVHDTELPTEISSQLSQYIDLLPVELVDLAVISTRGTKDLQDSFHAFSEIVQRLNTNGAYMLALAEAVEIGRPGEVKRRQKVYHAEHRVITSHVLLKILNNFNEGLHLKFQNLPPTIERSVEELLEYIQKLVVNMSEEYRTACLTYELPVDEETIACGIPSEDRDFARDLLYEQLESEIESRAVDTEQSRIPDVTTM